MVTNPEVVVVDGRDDGGLKASSRNELQPDSKPPLHTNLVISTHATLLSQRHYQPKAPRCTRCL
jgi:hypothetical protein